jgi:hypothetical protein
MIRQASAPGPPSGATDRLLQGAYCRRLALSLLAVLVLPATSFSETEQEKEAAILAAVLRFLSRAEISGCANSEQEPPIAVGFPQ